HPREASTLSVCCDILPSALSVGGEPMKGRLLSVMGLVLVLSLALGACAAPATVAPTAVPATAVPATSAPAPTSAPAATSGGTSGKYAGVTVNVLTFTGPQIAEPLQRHGPEFEKLTGAHINVVTVPFSELYQKALTDFATGTNSYDALVFDPQWMADFITPGY